MTMKPRASAVAISAVVVGLLALVVTFARTGRFGDSGVRCVHSLEAGSDEPASATPLEVITADPYASTETGLVAHEHKDPMYAGFRNERSVYWTQRLPDGTWRMMDRTRFSRCDRDAFTGEPFAPGAERPLRECRPSVEDEVAQDPTDIDLESADACESVGVPVSGILTGPIGS